MPLRLLHKWPKVFGFEIYGKGPCYVTSVQKGSMAQKSGLMPGDQLLELNGRDVTVLTSEQIRALAKPRAIKPPEVKVVSCLQTVEIKPELPVGYGFTIAGEKPVTVGSVEYGGPAYKAGLRTGDIILEVNSKSPVKLATIGSILSQLPGQLNLLTIPVARPANLVHVDKALSRMRTPDPRLYTARDLHAKLSDVLGNDHQSQTAVVTALKRYAEDRDLAVMCAHLNAVLRTRRQRAILQHIRLLIPPDQRPHFDDHINLGQASVPPDNDLERAQSEAASLQEDTGHHTRTQVPHGGLKKLIQVVREAGSFGFVVKSSCPAYIESVDSGGPAQAAGLQDGDLLLKLNGIDVRKVDHDRLIHLLQDSGSAPTLEILRGGAAGSGRTGTPSVRSSLSRHSSHSSSSGSSHDSADNILYSPLLTDADGKTFTDQVNYLLTTKEQSVVKKALREYDMKRDVVSLYSAVSAILDTPSRQMIWPFIFVLLSAPHREYVTHRVPMPEAKLMAITTTSGGRDAHSIDGREQEEEAADMGDFPPSFQQQIDFLLTSTERLQFKQCLKQYGRAQELGALVKTLEAILDSPSKRILWRLVLPRMTSGHREVMRGRLDLNGRQTASAPLNLTAMDSYIGVPDGGEVREEEGEGEDGHRLSSDTREGLDMRTDQQVLFGTDDVENQPNLSSSDDEQDSSDESSIKSGSRSREESSQSGLETNAKLMLELEQTRKAVMEVRDAIMAQNQKSESQFIFGADDVTDEDLRKDLEYLESRHFVTVIPIGQGRPSQADDLKRRSLYHRLAESARVKATSSDRKKGTSLVHAGATILKGDHVEREENLMELQDSHISGSESDDGEVDEFEDLNEEVIDLQEKNGVMAAHNQTSGTTLDHRGTLSALNQLDAVVAGETNTARPEFMTPHDIGTSVSRMVQQSAVTPGPRAGRDILNLGPRKPSIGLTKRWPSLAQVVSRNHNAGTAGGQWGQASAGQTQLQAPGVSSAPPPPAPPLPPPPPPAPPLPQASVGPSDQGQMSVKRINWEKLDNQKVENTIWEKLNSSDLRQVVKYLELESQFSTKPSRQRDVEKKTEVLIMDQRKAYNISILLGHLKMSVPEVKQALYSMDEKALAPELIGQLLAFAPSETEIAQYKSYSGDHSRLTKPDQFAYQISLVGDYEERLKALLFKASFKEKAEELRKDLENIKNASKELRNSKKLAGVLEVILAMGNYLNKGNSRVGEAAGFRISFLTQLDITKTSDNKSSFLHVLAEAAYSRFPELLSFSDELNTVDKAAKVSIEVLNQDIQDLKQNLEATSAALSRVGDHTHNSPPGDRFQDVMGHFLAEATDEQQSIFRLQAAAMTEFSQMVTFFGEDPKTMSTNDVFGIFSDFINNFEKAHRYNLMFKRQ